MYEFYLNHYRSNYGSSYYASFPLDVDAYPCVVVDFNDELLMITLIDLEGVSTTVLSPGSYIPGAWETLVPHPEEDQP